MPKAGQRQVKFGDVVRLSKARCQDPLGEGYERFVGLEHLEPGSLRIPTWGNVADGVTFTSVFKPGQVLFGKRRAYQRKVAVADFTGVCSSDIYVLESADPAVLLPELLPFICQTDAFFEHAVGTSAGSLSPRTNWTSLAGFAFALPPRDEQKKLVRVLSSALDCAHSAEKLVSSLGALRSSYIANYLSNGPQTEGMKTPFGAIPSHWNYQAIGDLTISSAYGPRFPSTLYSESGNTRTIRTTDFVGDDDLDLTTAPAATLEPKVVGEHRLVEGDFLLSRSGEYAGKTRVFDGSAHANEFIPAAFLIRYRLDQKKLRAKYLHYLCSSPIGQKVLSSLVQGSAQPNIAGSAFSALRVPIPPLSEQDELIESIERLTLARKLAAERVASSKNVFRTVLTATWGNLDV